MIVLYSVVSFLLLAYCCLILMYTKWYKSIKPFSIPQNYSPKNTFSVVIPARNESENIANCIKTICNNHYPSDFYEVIVVDDYSTDNTASIVLELQSTYHQITLIKLSDVLGEQQINAYKKKAIETAIAVAKNSFIVCTDADCEIPMNWLKNYDAYIQQTGAKFIAAPVEFIKDGSVLNLFQYIDFLAMQAITAAAVKAGFQSMCNGANVCYSKQSFIEVDGFKGIDNIASGDDMLLMEKIKQKDVSSVGYLFSKESVVKTLAPENVKAFLNQRVRWASKTKSYKDLNVLMVLVLVYVLNLSLLFFGLGSLLSFSMLLFVVFAITLKAIIEYYFLNQSKNLFSSFSFIKFVLLQPFHIVYIVVAGWLGYFKQYEWKGRLVK